MKLIEVAPEKSTRFVASLRESNTKSGGNEVRASSLKNSK
jgi:hypothetical protein